MGEIMRPMPVKPALHTAIHTGRNAAIAALLAGFAMAQPAGSQERAASKPTSFEESFADLKAPPPRPAKAADGAVDLDSFTPKREKPPAPPEPTGGNVVRTLGSGMASYYGKRFHGRRTANGERFNMNAMTAAHKTLPFGTKVRVTNPRNGRSVTVRINDRGPYAHGRVIDLSRAAAQRIGIIQAGHARVRLEIVS